MTEYNADYNHAAIKFLTTLDKALKIKIKDIVI